MTSLGPDYSIWDWKLGRYRYYRSPSPDGLFDPEVPHLPHSPQQLGFAVDHCLVSLPMGCQFLGTGERALGRIACDATSRSQASARLPEGIGGVGGTGGMGLVPFVPFLGLGEITVSGVLARLRPLIPIALAFAAGVLILKGLKPRRTRARNRRRNARRQDVLLQRYGQAQKRFHRFREIQPGDKLEFMSRRTPPEWRLVTVTARPRMIHGLLSVAVMDSSGKWDLFLGTPEGLPPTPVRFAQGRRRNAQARLKPGQIWQRGSGELWRACEVCATALGPFQSEAAMRAKACPVCAKAVAFDDAVTGRFQRPVLPVKRSKSVKVA